MKKFLLSCFALSALIFTACDKEDNTDVQAEDGYTLTISTDEPKIGDDITLTITGDNVNDMTWLACFNRVDDGSGSCLATPSTNGKIVVSLSASSFKAGEYKFYASYHGDEELHTNDVLITITE
ncbi:MAG: hypothetical protein R3Y08_05785 [Rikenellaceae bacterium]